MIKRLIVLALLFCLPAMAFGKSPEKQIKERDVVGIDSEIYLPEAKKAGVVEEKSPKVFEIKVKEWKEVPIRDRINLRVLDEVDVTASDTDKKPLVKAIIEEEIIKSVVKTEVVTIEVVDVTGQSGLLREEIDSRAASGVLKNTMRQAPTKQYAKTEFKGYIEDFIVGKAPTTQGKFRIVDVSDWLNLNKEVKNVKNDRNCQAVILGWGDECNEPGVVEIVDYPFVQKTKGIFYQRIKEVRPDLSIGVLVIFRADTMEAWVKALPFKPDFLALVNISDPKRHSDQTNWEKVRSKYFKDYDLVAADINIHGSQVIDNRYYALIERLKSLGYKGSVWFKQ